ncbi:Tim44/TimA family putative adaptor protein [Pelagibacterium montanilacus]|uniref:Tim44/TimA family putative adaptor protein n=1 Tax=Pelagibacterium montanilacus TaxID=2185280 RepID=UPI0013DEB9BB|nr:Tim44/TimA family putative adaptor protein [Pelagibacterium montanilacus]
MGEFLDFPTIIVIIVAIVVLLRLRSVLGTRTGNERPPSPRYENISRKREDKDDTVVQMPTRKPQPDDADAERFQRKREAEIEKFSNGDEAIARGLSDIAEADPAFSPKQFIEGAKSAYEMIVTAFAAGDRKTLKMLLDKEVYDSFEAAIAEREAAGQTVEFTFVGLNNIVFTEVELDKRNAVVSLRIDAEVVSVTHDAQGEVLEGTPGQVVPIADEWTFMRNTRARDPNWKLVATDDLE